MEWNANELSIKQQLAVKLQGPLTSFFPQQMKLSHDGNWSITVTSEQAPPDVEDSEMCFKALEETSKWTLS